MILRGKDYEINSKFPDTNFYPDDNRVTDIVPNDSLIAKIIRENSPYFDKVYDGAGKLTDVIPWPEIPYTKDKSGPVLPGEVITITCQVQPVTVWADGTEYPDTDGIIQYSNQNPGIHEIVLQTDGYKPTIVEVTVSAG